MTDINNINTQSNVTFAFQVCVFMWVFQACAYLCVQVCVCVCVPGEEFSSRQQQSFVRMRMTKAVSGVFRTQVFSSRRTSLSDAHRFCQDSCSRDACCDGFILNQNSLNGGALPWRQEHTTPGWMNEWMSEWIKPWRRSISPPPLPLPPRYSALWLAESSVSLDVRGPGLGYDWTGNSQSYLWGGANLQRAAEELRVRLWRTKVHHQWETETTELYLYTVWLK